MLEELELRAGFVSKTEPFIKRAISFKKALEEYLNTLHSNSNSFFYESFKLDDLGVACELLKWRDSLLLAGWNENISGVSSKLDEMAAIEKIFRKDLYFLPGKSDRWVRMYKFSSNNIVLENNDVVEVKVAESSLLPLIDGVLKNIRRSGVQVVYGGDCGNAEIGSGKGTNLSNLQAFLRDNSKKFNWNKDDNSLELIHFKNMNTALEWAASYSDTQKYEITICSDTKSFNDNLQVFGKPLVNSRMTDSNPQLLQLLNLGISLFMRPLDMDNLLSYLLVPVNPLPGKLRCWLVEALTCDNGLGDTWQSVFDGNSRYIFTSEKTDGTESPETEEDISYKERKMKFISMVMNDSHIKNVDKVQYVSKDAIMDFVSALMLWSNSRSVLISSKKDISSGDLETKEQLLALNTICETFMYLLKYEPDFIPQNKLSKWLSHIYVPGTFHHKSAQKGSVDVVEDIHDITDKVDTLLWLGCNGDSSVSDIYGFLSMQEKVRLSEKGVRIVDFENLVLSEKNDVRRVVLSVGRKITVVFCDKQYADPLTEHYFLSIIRKAFGMGESEFAEIVTDNPLPCAGFSEENLQKDLYPRVIQEGFREGILKRKQDGIMSYSQLEKLIQRPFQYVIEYIAGLRDVGIQSLDDIVTLQGTLAHKYIEYLVKKGQNDAHFSLSVTEDEFNRIMDSLAVKNAALMLLDKNRIHFNTYKKRLYSSIGNLQEIITGNDLRIEASEYQCDNELDVFGKFTGNIDLLLRTEEGRYVIFDLKWSESSRYNSKLKENKDSQLRLYEELLEKEGKDVDYTAYYILSKGELLVKDLYGDRIVNKNHVRIIKGNDSEDVDLMEKLKSSYRFRVDQLERGIVEDAEGLPISDLDYEQNTEECNLLPLDRDGKVKYHEYGNKNRILRGDLK